MKDDTGLEGVKFLFLSDFYSKVLNAVAMTRSKTLRDSWLMWTKSPCDNVAPQLTNVWTQFSGFRKGFICLIYFYETVFQLFITIKFSYDNIFDRDILKDLSCRVIKGSTQHWPPFSYIQKDPGMINIREIQSH